MFIIPRFRPNLSAKKMAKILKENLFNSLRPDENQRSRQILEEKLAGYLGVRNAICVPSARMGLFLILKNLGLDSDSEVILPAFTYWAVPEMISFLKYKPVFVDINSRGWNLDVSLIERSLTAKTRVIIPTHLYGLPCNMDEVVRIAKKYNLLIIGDCVQSCGAEYNGHKHAILGDAAYFSFGITKNVFLLGGGVVTTDKKDLAKRIRNEVREYTFLTKFQISKRVLEALIMKINTHPAVFSYCLFPLIRLFNQWNIDIVNKIYDAKKGLDNSLPQDYYKVVPYAFAAEAGLEQIENLDSLNNKRIQNALYYLENLKGIKELVLPPYPRRNIKNIFTNFPVQIKNRGFLIKQLLKKGIDVSRGYIKAQDMNCPNAVSLEESILHLPVYPQLSEAGIQYICNSIKEIFKRS